MSEVRTKFGTLEPVFIWRIVLGFGIAIGLYLAIALILFYGALIFATPVGFNIETVVNGSSKFGIALFLSTFFPVWVGVYVAMLWPVKQPFSRLFGESGTINWRDARIGFGVTFALVAVFEGITALGFNLIGQTHHMTNQAFVFSQWIIWVFPILILIACQIGAEEIVFRGYLLRTIWSRGGRMFWAVFAPAFIFGIGHFSPDVFGHNAWFYVMNTTVTGVILACITLFRNNIGAVLGVHFAVNIFSFVVVGNADYFSAMSIFLTDIAPKSWETTLAFVAFTILEVLAYGIWAKSKYGRLVP